MDDAANFALFLSAGALFGMLVVNALRWITRDLAP